MKVILLKAVPKVGKPEEIVEVSEGFARNSLFPQKLAIPATDAAVLALSNKQSARATEKVVRHTLMDRAIVEATGKSLVYFVPANEKGNLFSKIDNKTIAEFLMNEHRLDIDPACIHIEGGSIKKIGEHSIAIVDGSYRATVILEVKRK